MVTRSFAVRSRSLRPRRGAAVVETAMVLSVVLVSILGVLEYGRIVMLRHLMDNAAREGARLAIVGTAFQPETTTQAIIDVVHEALAGQSFNSLAISVDWIDPETEVTLGAWNQANYGDAIRVKVEAEYVPVLPTTLGILPEPFQMTAIATMRSEAN